MSARALLAQLLFALTFVTACKAPPPAPAGPPSTASAWVAQPAFGSGLPSGQKLHVRCDDAARSKLGPRLEAAFAEAVTAKGYATVPSEADADYLCVVVVRYFGKTVPPGGRENLLARATDPIQGGGENWLAADGSGFDTQVRTPRALRFRPGTRTWFGDQFKEHQDDEWTLLVDVAIGARRPDQPNVVQRHEGRGWSSVDAYELDRARAGELVVEELTKRFADCVP